MSSTKRKPRGGDSSGWWIKTIHVLLPKTGMHDSDYRGMLMRLYGKESSKLLTYHEAMDFIDRLKALGTNTPPPPMEDRGVWISPAQRRKIMALCAELGWKTPEGTVDKKRLFGFIHHQLDDNKALDMLLVREASRVITGLERLHYDLKRKKEHANTH